MFGACAVAVSANLVSSCTQKHNASHYQYNRLDKLNNVHICYQSSVFANGEQMYSKNVISQHCYAYIVNGARNILRLLTW